MHEPDTAPSFPITTATLTEWLGTGDLTLHVIKGLPNEQPHVALVPAVITLGAANLVGI